MATPDLYSRHTGRYSDELARAVVAAASLAPGQRVLDVGCGPGALTRAVAAVVGAGAVAAIDPDPARVEACRAAVPGADVRVGTAEALPFADGVFDAVVSQLVVNLLDDPAAGVAEMARVARVGGVVAAAVWDFAEGMTLLRAFWEAAEAVVPEAAAWRDEPEALLARPAELARLWRGADLSHVETGEAVVSARYEGFDDLWEPFAAGVGKSTGALVLSLDPPRRAALAEAYRRRLGVPAGRFELTARAWIVAGRR
jgi:ubiquinone/menaquinone biosynthesis C-methylase UbiE